MARENKNMQAEKINKEVYKLSAEAAKRQQQFPAIEWQRLKQAIEAAVEKEPTYIEHLKTNPTD